MFLEENDSTVQHITDDRRGALYMLVKSYVEHECRLSQTFTRQQDLDREVQSRLAKIFS